MQNGLSVLIPVFNVNVLDLANQLYKLLTIQSINFEIKIYDDGSADDIKIKNRQIDFPNSIYIELEKNIGRSAIRNKLVNDALYNMVLILDCDVKIKRDDYIIRYIPFLDSKVAVSGGTEYEDTVSDLSTVLHWKAGKLKEQKPFDVRNQHPYHSFTLNNLLISKSIYQEILLDEKIKTYGHEDSKFGIELERKNIKLVHIDNPVYHIGLNSAEQFISKSISAAENLAILVKTEQIGINTQLYKVYEVFKKTKTLFWFMYIFNIFKPLIYKNLQSKNPKLFFLDFIKLHAFTSKISVK